MVERLFLTEPRGCLRFVIVVFPDHTHFIFLGMRSIGQNSTFSECGHGAYQIKKNHECSNMVANILPADTPTTIGMVNRSKLIFFQNMVMLHIKLNGITKCSNMVTNILPTAPNTPDPVNRSKDNYFRI